MADELDSLLALLEVKQLRENVFSGNSPDKPRRVFGGQVLAQALDAAGQTVKPDRSAHSMHAYFIRPGNPEKEILYEVDLIRDGGSFTTRNVIARQDGKAIFTTSISFHVEEAGLEHQPVMPEVPPPEELETEHDRWAQLARKYPGRFVAPFIHPIPIERRTVQPRDLVKPAPREPVHQFWLRALGDPGKNYRKHQILLAFISDFGLLGTTLFPHPYSGFSENVMSASLDHALWFHRAFRADEYLLYHIESPAAAGARGFSRGSFFTRDGMLVASSAQESLIRLRDD